MYKLSNVFLILYILVKRCIMQHTHKYIGYQISQSIPHICTVAIYGMLVLINITQTAYSAELPGKDKQYPFFAKNQKLSDILTAFSNNTHITISISQNIENNTINFIPQDLSREEFLSFLAVRNKFLWFYDGNIIHISHIKNMVIQPIALKNINVEKIRKYMNAMDIWEEKFFRYGKDTDNIMLVAAPESYLRIVKEIAKVSDVTLPEAKNKVTEIEYVKDNTDNQNIQTPEKPKRINIILKSKASGHASSRKSATAIAVNAISDTESDADQSQAIIDIKDELLSSINTGIMSDTNYINPFEEYINAAAQLGY